MSKTSTARVRSVGFLESSICQVVPAAGFQKGFPPQLFLTALAGVGMLRAGMTRLVKATRTVGKENIILMEDFVGRR